MEKKHPKLIKLQKLMENKQENNIHQCWISIHTTFPFFLCLTCEEFFCQNPNLDHTKTQLYTKYCITAKKYQFNTYFIFDLSMAWHLMSFQRPSWLLGLAEIHIQYLTWSLKEHNLEGNKPSTQLENVKNITCNALYGAFSCKYTTLNLLLGFFALS